MQLSSILPNVFFDFLVYLIAGIVAALFFYNYRRKALLGGFWGGVVIGTVGAVLISMITELDRWFFRVITWLMQPKIGSDLLFRVNLITAVLGAFLFVVILNVINHDKKR